RSNIHYLGQRTYEELPALLAGWDICLLPFAKNESTRFISPTKTLEYMAAEKPIVAIALTDVVALYGNEISAVETHAEFIDACSSALTKTAHERGTLNKKMRARLRGTSWDLTVAQMLPLLRVSTLKDSVVARGLLRNAETEQNRKAEDDQIGRAHV